MPAYPQRILGSCSLPPNRVGAARGPANHSNMQHDYADSRCMDSKSTRKMHVAAARMQNAAVFERMLDHGGANAFRLEMQHISRAHGGPVDPYPRRTDCYDASIGTHRQPSSKVRGLSGVIEGGWHDE